MDLNPFLQPLAGAIGIAAYIVVIVGILKTKMEQSFAAFMLWAMLDIIATVTTIMQDGNYWLPLSNAFGSSIITILLIIKKQVSWSRVETLTAILVAVCLVIWYIAGEKAGMIASSLAVVIASVPQMADTFRKPEATPAGAYIIFLFANIVSFVAGKSWTVEERFYPACSIFLCLVIIVFAMRKKNRHPMSG